MSDQEYFYLLMGIYAMAILLISVWAFVGDAKINKRIRRIEKEFLESLFDEDKGVE